MNQKIKNVFYTLYITLVIVSCKQENSIQTYIVEHQDQAAFLTLDVSPKMMDFSKVELNEADLKVYNAFDKISIIAYKAEGKSEADYTKELEKVKIVFNNKKYSELMAFSDNGIKFRMNTLGDNDTVNEFLVLASSSELGFAVVRVLGNNMQPEKLYKLVENMKDTDLDKNQLMKIMDYFKH